MNAVRAGSGLVAVALASVAGLAPVHSQQAFKSAVDLVRVPVVVSGKGGLLTRGLTAKDFDVLEDGVSQKIVAFAEGAPGDELPLYLGLLFDVSGSMELDLHDAANAAVQFVTALDEATDVTLVEFASTIRVGRFSRDSYPSLFERIRNRKADGETALHDAIGVSVSLQQGKAYADVRVAQHTTTAARNVYYNTSW